MNQGDSVGIPKSIGRWRTSMSTIAAPQGLAALAASHTVISVAVVAVEEDDSPDDAAEQGRQALVKTIESSVNLAVQSAVAPDVGTISGQATDAVRNAVKGASLSVWTVLPLSDLFTLGAIADPDDLVGFGLAGPFDFQQIRDAGAAGIPFTIDLIGSDSKEGWYRVTGRVTGDSTLSVRNTALACGISPPLSIRKQMFGVGNPKSPSLWDHLIDMQTDCVA